MSRKFVSGNHVFSPHGQALAISSAHPHFSPAGGALDQPGTWLRNWIVLIEFERHKPQPASQPSSQKLSELNLSSWHITFRRPDSTIPVSCDYAIVYSEA